MRMFDQVVVLCDNSSYDEADAVRAALEVCCLRPYVVRCRQKQHVLAALAGDVPPGEYVVMMCHGLEEPDAVEPQPMKMGFHAMDEVDGRWTEVEVALTPENIPQLVRLPGRKVIALGCGTGRKPLAEAFLESGCTWYIGAVRPVDQDSAVLFATAFFYQLCSEPPCDDRGAFCRALESGIQYREGQNALMYFAPSSPTGRPGRR